MTVRSRARAIAAAGAMSVALGLGLSAAPAIAAPVAAEPAADEWWKPLLRSIFAFDCWFGQFEPGHKVFCFE